MTTYDSLPEGVTEIFGAQATAEEAYGLLTVDVPADSWIAALLIARDSLGCTYFDWLSAVDEPGTGFRVCAHVVSLGEGRVRRLLLRTTVPHTAAVLPSAIDVYAGAAWHERETHEMFGIDFSNHPHLVPLLLPENFEGHPLRKDFVLAARVAKAWPGAKEPGESEHGGPKRRQMLPPGVPDPNEWGPLKGQLPPAPARPARTPRAAAGAGAGAGAGGRPVRAAGDRPARRARSVSEGSASQAGAATPAASGTSGTPAASESTAGAAASGTPGTSAASGTPGTSAALESTAGAAASGTPGTSAASEASGTPAPPATPGTPGTSEASAAPETPTAPEAQGASADPGASATPAAQATPPARPRRSRSAGEGSVSQTSPNAPETPEAPPAPGAAEESGPGADEGRQPAAPPRTRSSDAPWHNPKPAFAEEAPEAEPAPDAGTGEAEPNEPAEPTDPAGGDPRE
uniref:NADH-quinone oxidoreductase subunit C n=1 Tax=Streptomyces sp. NBC_00003 TaxID=2903608 RepID=A0AAU2V453_9ACTN